VTGLQLAMAGLDALAGRIHPTLFELVETDAKVKRSFQRETRAKTYSQTDCAAANPSSDSEAGFWSRRCPGSYTSRQMDTAHVRLRRVETTNEM